MNDAITAGDAAAAAVLADPDVQRAIDLEAAAGHLGLTVEQLINVARQAASAPPAPAAAAGRSAVTPSTPPAATGGGYAAELDAIKASGMPMEAKLQRYRELKDRYPGETGLVGGVVHRSWT